MSVECDLVKKEDQESEGLKETTGTLNFRINQQAEEINSNDFPHTVQREKNNT